MVAVFYVSWIELKINQSLKRKNKEFFINQFDLNK